MSRKSRREIESDIDELAGDGDATDLADVAVQFCYDDETPDRNLDLVTADGFAFYADRGGD